MYFATGAALTAALNALPTSLTGTYKAFDAFYYADKYMGSYTGTLSPIEHFVQVGAARGYKPNADFDPTYYQSKYADLASFDAADLLFHYVKFGLNEGRPGNATLATYKWADYLTAYPDVAKYVNDNLASFGGSATNGAIAHYVKFGAVQGFTVPGSVPAQSLTLTTGVDTGSKFVGGAGDDTFVSVDTQVASTQTLTSGDSLDGGLGTDILLIAASGGGAVAAPLVSTAGVETLNVTNNNTGTYTIDSSLMSGLKTVQMTAGAADLIVSNGSTILNASLVSSSRSLSLTPASGTAGTADEMSLTINGAGTTANSTVTANGIETINLTSTGTASGNATNSTRVVVASTELDKLVVSGEANARLTVSFAGATGTDVSTLDASKTTGGVNASITLGASNIANITGGTGNDSFTLGTMSKLHTVTGGTGTDTITVSAASYDKTLTTQNAANVSGFETLSIAASGSADVRSFSGNTGFTTFEAAGATATITGLSTTAATLTAKTIGGTITATRATDGTTDAMTVNLSPATPGTFTALSIVDEETIAIASGGTATGDNVITTLTATDATSLTVSGARSLSIGTLTGATALATLNASGNTGSVFSVDASASAANMTATGSAGVNSSDGAIVNTITTGSGNDTITGGAYYDSLTGGAGNDSISGGAGNDKLYGNANNDTIDGGDGDDLLDGDVGNDSLTGGAGNDTIQASSGNDTVSGGAGNDAIYVASLSDDDSIDGGTDTDTLSLSAPTTTGAGPTVAQYVAVSDSVVAKITAVETGYLAVTTTSTNTTAALALTADLTAVSGMSTLWLDINDAGGDEFVLVKNFGGSTVNYTETANAESLTIDGINQAALTLNVRGNTVNATTEVTAFTGLEAVTVSGQSQINSSNKTNTLGTVKADTASSATLKTTGSTISASNANALTVDSLSAANANTVAVNAGAYDTLTVTQDVNAINGLVQTLNIDAGTSALVAIGGGDFVLTGSTVRNANIALGADSQLYSTADTATIDIEASTVSALAMTLGANSKASLDFDTNVTAGTVTMSSGSQWNVNTIGGTGVSSITLTGTGDVDAGKTGAVISPDIRVIGTTVTFSSSGLTDADSLSVSSTASTKATISLPSTATGAGEISSGAGTDVLTGGNGADRFGFTGRTETVTVVYDANDTMTYTANGIATATVTAGTDLATTIGLLAAAINATSATSFATAAVTGTGIVTVSYNQFFGTAGTKAYTDVDGDTVGSATVAVGVAGDNAGADTISGGLGSDTILGGSGADDITVGTGGATASGADTVIYIGDSDTQVGVVATGFTFTGDILRGIGSTDVIDLSKLANIVVAGATYTNSTTFATATANQVVVVTGSLNESTGVFTAGASSATNNDYLLQYNGGATTTTVNTIALVDITGTVSITALNELLTITVS